MGRFVLAGFVSCMALCLAATAVGAEDDKGELERLRRENQGLKAAQLEQDITAYLAETKAWQGAEGGDGLKGVSVKAAFCAVTQGTLGQSSNGADDMAVADGDFDLNFDLQVSDDVSLFCYMTANTGGRGTFPSQFATDGITQNPGLPFPLPFGLTTNAGLTDGIDVNGTVPTNPGSVQTNEVGVRVATHLGNTVLHWEMGEIDPRRRFLQNAFVPDNNTTFIHNSFTDPASIQWITTSMNVGSLGWYMWLEFGNQKQFTLSWGWFNAAPQWWIKGQFYVQFGWKAEVGGREMNLKFLLHSDWYNGNTGPGPGAGFATEESNIALGWSWDWWVHEKIGLFFTGGFNVDDNNPVDYDFAVGAVFAGLIQSRPDDQFGAGFVFTHLDEDVVGTPDEETEFAFELYYRLAMANGKVWVTPHMIFLMNPGGGVVTNGGLFADDSVFILGVRIYVPF
jgi:hypothetical protein